MQNSPVIPALPSPEDVRAVSPALAQYMQNRLHCDLWNLNRAMDNGLTRRQASEVLTHLAFYAGWPNVFSALPVVKDVFEKSSR